MQKTAFDETLCPVIALDGLTHDSDVKPSANVAQNRSLMPKPTLLPISSTDFREAMSRVAGAVHIIATNGAGGLAGATATAVTSVSDTPPSLLVCLNQASKTLLAIQRNNCFSINILDHSHQSIADVFAGQTGVDGPSRFMANQGWNSLTDGPPVLLSALASFKCGLSNMTPVGSHVILIGTVEHVSVGGEGQPLLYHRRAYKTL
jgi:flavin reductase (DIM6/NTAB) family NADH-FMN oxidoreductase RutF